MITNEQKFVRKYSFRYTLIVAILLLIPFYFHILNQINMQEILTEKKIKAIQSEIIYSMEMFGNKPEKTYHFLKFKDSQSGLYTQNFSPIYTQLKKLPPNFSIGYHSDGKNRYLVTQLPPEKYFHAYYLISVVKISFTSVVFKAGVMLFSIMLVVLLLSFYFFKSFSMPFIRVNSKLDAFIKESMHEINTPLSIINVNVDLFETLQGSNKYMKRIKSATKSLSTLYNDMDYLIKEDRVRYEKEHLSFNTFLQERVTNFELISQLKEIEIILEMSHECKLFFSKTKLERIVDNTLSNAIKFSHKKSKIEISLSINSSNNIEFRVKDYGQGIKNPQKILERYYREDESKNGFGIGMSIVKSIIDKENIVLCIHSEKLKGSEFIYEFPQTLQVNT